MPWKLGDNWVCGRVSCTVYVSISRRVKIITMYFVLQCKHEHVF